MQFVDVFGFAGGFATGMVRAGFELVGKKEGIGGFGVANMLANRHITGYNWEPQSCNPHEWDSIHATVISGNPPCSGFSPLSTKTFRGMDSPANVCMHEFTDYVLKSYHPGLQAVVFESVQQAYSGGMPLMRRLHQKVVAGTGVRWNLTHVLHNALHVGGAAERKRYFWVLTRGDFGVEFEDIKTPLVMDVIGDLQDLEWQWEPQPYKAPAEWWMAQSGARSNATLTVDGHIGITSAGHKRCLDLLEVAGWEEGKTLSDTLRRYCEGGGELPSSWDPVKEKIFAKDFDCGINQPCRWRTEKPCRVITGGALHNAIHPTRPRYFTHREAARIMGFPDNWKIEPLRHVSGLSATWGKGITVQCGSWVGGWLKAAIEGEPGSISGVEVGEWERVLDLTHGTKSLLKPRMPKV